MAVLSKRDHAVERILGAVSDQEIVDLELVLVRILSYTGEESELAEIIVKFLRSHDIEADLQEVPLTEHFREKTERKVSHNVIGRLRGNGTGPSLIFNGHMDHGPWEIGKRAVDDFSRWMRSPTDPVVENGLIYGKGAQDEKGGICAMLGAAVSLRRAGVRLRGDIYFCPVMGHKTHSIGTKFLLASGLRADYGINTENSGNWIVPVHVGIASAHIRVKGVNPKGRSRLPEMAGRAGAFMNVARLITRLGPEGIEQGPNGWLTYQPHPVLKHWPVYRVEYIRKITATDVDVGLLVTIVPGQDEGTIRRDLERAGARLQMDHSDFEVGAITTELWGPPLETPISSPVIQALKRWDAELSGEPPRVGLEGRWGSYGCGALMGAAGIETVIYGPGGQVTDPFLRQRLSGELPPDESIAVKELLQATRVMALAAYDLSG